MAGKRIPASRRKASILAAARLVFSRNGYEAAKTREVAAQAGVSEALIFRHFPTKLALYRAVLRQIIREQDQNFAEYSPSRPDAAGIIGGIASYFRHAVILAHDERQRGNRMLLASLAGDGTYSRLVYRRARRMIDRSVDRAMAQAKDDGYIVGELLPVGNTSMFIEHVGTMMGALVSTLEADAPYSVSGEDLVRQAVWFCCRGLGFRDDVIARHIDA